MDFKQHQRILIVTTSGGGGHLQAANATILNAQSQNPNVKIFTYNLVAQAGGKLLGKLMVNHLWDTAQRKGYVRLLELWASVIPVFDLLFWIPVFLQILRQLIKNDIDHVIDTQPMCLSALVYAVKLYSKMKKKDVKIDKVLTELPTRYAIHYLRPIKRLHPEARKIVTLISTTPLLHRHETAGIFWNETCGLPETQIKYGELPIRPSFKSYHKEKITSHAFPLSISLKSPKELEIIQSLVSRHLIKGLMENTTLKLTIQPTDKVITLMLGSQPVQQATLNYVKKFIEMILPQENHPWHYYLIVFCSQKKPESLPLQEKLYSLLIQDRALPKNMSVVPLSSQNDEIIAPLFFRSNATLTKSGGVTAMELLSVATGKIFIHQENSSSASDRGMPKWEYGNASYLQEMKGATLITPDTLCDHAHHYLCH